MWGLLLSNLEETASRSHQAAMEGKKDKLKVGDQNIKDGKKRIEDKKGTWLRS